MEWTDEGIAGRVRFLDRVWRACAAQAAASRAIPLDRLPDMRGEAQVEIVRSLHAALKSGSEESSTYRFHYNTTLARLDELVNAMTKFAQTPGADGDPALLYAVHALPLVLAPFAPHIAEELWERAGYSESVHLQHWPDYDPAALTVALLELVVQVNGKIRARLSVAPGISESEATQLAFADANVASHLTGKTVRKQIFVPDRLLNIVAS
jgi:leucyl-tRNA synthetase